MTAQRLYLDTPVTYLKGVGPARADALRRLGIITAGDLLFHIPHRYEDASTVSPIRSLEPGMDGTIVGTVISKGIIPTRKGLRIFQAVLRDETGMMEVSWPGQPFLDRTINKGDYPSRFQIDNLLPFKGGAGCLLEFSYFDNKAGKFVLAAIDHFEVDKNGKVTRFLPYFSSKQAARIIDHVNKIKDAAAAESASGDKPSEQK